LLFSSGFSTTDLPSDLSGRGVGLDVVKKKVESVNGTIDVRSAAGEGLFLYRKFTQSRV
jgi:two-component system chemotaxis sensor kinase CheA